MRTHTVGGGVVINEFVKEDRDDAKIAQGVKALPPSLVTPVVE